MGSLKIQSLDLRGLAQAVGTKFPDIGIGFERIQDSINLINNRLSQLAVYKTGDGATRLDLAQAKSGTLANSAFDRTSSDRIQITDADIVSLNAGKITAGTIDGLVVNITNLSADNINTGTLNGLVVNLINLDGANLLPGTISAEAAVNWAGGSANVVNGFTFNTNTSIVNTIHNQGITTTGKLRGRYLYLADSTGEYASLTDSGLGTGSGGNVVVRIDATGKAFLTDISMNGNEGKTGVSGGITFTSGIATNF